jgi:hypothetical protein
MAQHDYDLANQAGAAFRSDLNAALAAIVTNNSGATAPATTYAHMWWADTTAGILKRRNAANTAWISVMSLTLAFSAIGESLAAAASASAARSAISAAASGANSDITSLSGLTTALSIAQGGTGAATASAARTALGLAIGTDVQAFDTNLRPRVSSTPLSSTSGTAIDFTGIPSWVKRITVMLDGVSTSGTSILLFQLGDSGGIEATGYAAVSSVIYGTTPSTISSTGGFPVNVNQASNVTSGACVFTLLAGNTWTAAGILSGLVNSAQTAFVSGIKATSATLDRVRITTLNGTDTFDVGSINILYE